MTTEERLAAIPLDELREDLRASREGIRICEAALGIGHTHHRDGLPVADRLEGERRIVAVIEAELARRGKGASP